jgi:hypothetical protein
VFFGDGRGIWGMIEGRKVGYVRNEKNERKTRLVQGAFALDDLVRYRRTRSTKRKRNKKKTKKKRRARKKIK